MQKIIFIGSVTPYKGGISHFNTCLVNELRKKHDVKVISWERNYPKIIYPIDQVEKEDLHIIKEDKKFLLDFYNPLTWLKASKIIKKEKPQLVILAWSSPILSPIYTFITHLVKKNTKTMLLCHNVLQHEGTILDRLLLKIFINKPDYFIVHSRKDLHDLECITKNKKIQLGFHPVYDMFKSNKAINSKTTNTILFFGYIREYKGLIYLIKAMPEVLKGKNVRLLIVGEFWESKRKTVKLLTKIVTGKDRLNKEFYINEIKKLGLQDNIEVIDKYIPNEEVGKYFSRSDLLVLPYTSATQSGPLQVAYNFNIPVICTNVGGLPDVVEEGKTGYVVEPKNSQQISEAIIKFYKKNNKKEFMNNIKKIKNKYSWKKYAEKIESFI